MRPSSDAKYRMAILLLRGQKAKFNRRDTDTCNRAQQNLTYALSPAISEYHRRRCKTKSIQVKALPPNAILGNLMPASLSIYRAIRLSREPPLFHFVNQISQKYILADSIHAATISYAYYGSMAAAVVKVR